MRRANHVEPLRKGANYRYRRKVPDDLTAYFGFASWVFSLGTRDLHLANAKASKYAVDHGNLIEIARQKLTVDPAARFGALVLTRTLAQPS